MPKDKWYKPKRYNPGGAGPTGPVAKPSFSTKNRKPRQAVPKCGNCNNMPKKNLKLCGPCLKKIASLRAEPIKEVQPVQEAKPNKNPRMTFVLPVGTFCSVSPLKPEQWKAHRTTKELRFDELWAFDRHGGAVNYKFRYGAWLIHVASFNVTHIPKGA